MKEARNLLWIVLLAGVAAWSLGCSDSGSGGNEKNLTIGNTYEQSIKADDSNDYKFTTNDSGAYQIYFDSVSSGDPTTLDVTIDGTIVCSYAGNAATCTIQENLDAATKYTFTLTELAGEDQTYRIEVSH